MEITYHRDDVNFVTESLHKLYVELFEFVTVRCDEVETSVHPERQSYDIYSYVQYDGNNKMPLTQKITMRAQMNYLVSRRVYEETL